jgi:hypothetical protein
MIPNPSRMKYHGKAHRDLYINIVDIYKVYESVFNIRGVVEAVKTASIHDPEQGKTCIYPDPKFVAVSKHPLELDAACTVMMGKKPSENRYLKRAAETFGHWSQEINVLKNAGIRVPGLSLTQLPFPVHPEPDEAVFQRKLR